jgi:hypothetical protein
MEVNHIAPNDREFYRPAIRQSENPNAAKCQTCGFTAHAVGVPCPYAKHDADIIRDTTKTWVVADYIQLQRLMEEKYT